MKTRFPLLCAALGLVVTLALLHDHRTTPATASRKALAASTGAKSQTPGTQPNATTAVAAEASAGPGGAIASFNNWLGRWMGQVAAGKTGQELKKEVAAGVQAAAARRAEMEQLIRKDPAGALREAVSWHEWRALPSSVRDLIEEPFSETGSIEVVADCRPVAARKGPWQSHRVTLRGENYDAFVYGRRSQLTTKKGVPLQGIRLGKDVALWESPVQLLELDEWIAARETLPDGNKPDRSWLTGREIVGDPTLAAIGGRLHYFATEEEAQVITDAIVGAERRPGPHTVAKAMAAMEGDSANGTFNVAAFEEAVFAAASAWTETPKTVLCLRLDFTPSLGTPYSQAELLTTLSTCSDVIRAMSYGKTWVTPTVTSEVLSVPGSEYSDGYVLGSAASAAAVAAGYNLAAFDLILYSFPSTGDGRSVANYGGPYLWINGRQPPSVITHEFGHSYGLGHANYWTGLTGAGFLGRRNPNGSLVELAEYGDIFDIMGDDRYASQGGTAYYPQNHFSMYSKALLNWIEPGEVREVTADGVYRVYRFDHQNARLAAPDTTTLALRVRGPAAEELWVGYRPGIPDNASTANGAYIIWAAQQGSHCLLDATPLSTPNATYTRDLEDAALPPYRSYTDPSGTVRITNLRSGGSAPREHLDIQVEFLHQDTPPFELFTDFTRATPGLRGLYINRNLGVDAPVDNWVESQVVVGSRVDSAINFTGNGWGSRSTVGLTHGSDADWNEFSVQWDGVIVVNRPLLLGMKSDDGSRMWLDLDGDRTFGTSGREFISNNWGAEQAVVGSPSRGAIQPGSYHIRIQYCEENGANLMSLVSTEPLFEVFADSTLSVPGLTGSYVNRSLRTYMPRDDWRMSQTIAGTRTDDYPGLTSATWGSRAPLRLTGGSDENWDNFSVQWDGYLRVHRPVRMATLSDDGSRCWIDLDHNGHFGSTEQEFLNNGWGIAHNVNMGDVSGIIAPGTYRIRAQYEEGEVLNSFVLAGAPAEPPATEEAGYALAFNGTQSYATLDRLVAGDFTIEFWFRSVQNTGPDTAWWAGRGIVDATVSPSFSAPLYDGFGVTLGQGKILFGTGGGIESTIRSGFVADGAWHHVAATRMMESGAMALYVDGVRAATGMGSQGMLDAAPQMNFGRLQWGGNYFWGALDEVRIWKVARSEAEIAHSLRCSDLGSTQLTANTNLLAYWRMNEGAGTVARSESLDAILRQGAGWVPSGAPVERCGFGSLVDTGSVWSYWDLGTDPGSAWYLPDLGNAQWTSGSAGMGFGSGSESTMLQTGSIAYYFRHAFEVTDPSAIASVFLQMKRNDGSIVYLNGAELFRHNMPTGRVDYFTFALPPAQGNPQADFITYSFGPEPLVSGMNILAVEVHRASLGSTNLGFDLSLQTIPRNCPIAGCPPDLTAFTCNPDGAVVSFNPWATNSCTGEAVGLTCLPPPGSWFQVGTTTVNCYTSGSTNPVCSFAVTVVPDSNCPVEPSCSTNLLVNGSFEQPGLPDGYVVLSGNMSMLSGWVPILNGVEYFNPVVAPGNVNTGVAAAGNYLVNLTPPNVIGGGVQQTFATVKDRSYRVSFAMGASKERGRDGTASLTVNAAGQAHAFNMSTDSPSIVWERRHFSFTANSTSTTIVFSTMADPAASFVNLDDVRVSDCCEGPGLKVTSTITVEWGCGTLQSAPEVTGPYRDVSEATSPHTEPVIGPRKFWRTHN